MKLAVYQPYLKERGGAEKVVKEIADRSSHEVTIFTLFYDRENTFSEFENLDIEVVADEDFSGSWMEQAFKFGLKPVIRKMDLDDYDTLLISEGGLGFSATFRNHDLPVICYCHTPLRIALPEFRERYFGEFPSWFRPFLPLVVQAFNVFEKLGWRNYDHVIANSKVTRSRILEKGLAEEVEVVNPGTETDFEEGEFGDYIFYPSRFEPYKRQELAIKAFERADTGDFELVLAGSSADKEYLSQLRDAAGENVRIETDVSGERWRELYSNAYSVIFTAEKEDWGMVPLEAMAHGKPVIATNEGGPKEQVVEGETGFLVEPEPEKIAEKIELLARDRERVNEMGEDARQRAKKYSWQSFIEKFDRQVEEALE